MNRIGYFLRAKTAYGIHSPFVYGLYTEVLFSRCSVPREVGRVKAARAAWRLAHHYGVDACKEADGVVVRANGLEFLVVDHPHKCEERWQQLMMNDHWQVLLDFWRFGIAIHNVHLSKQHFVLR